MSKLASKVVAQAQKWLGYKESNGTHKQIINVYNLHKPLARNYRVKYTDAWCATFVSAVAIVLGYTDIIPTECSCQKMIELMKKRGIWIENESRVPNAGDIIFYDWQDNGVGDNKGHSDHVGIVEKVFGNTITIIEGNYSNAVRRRNLAVNAKYIRGYGVPKYDKEETKMKVFLGIGHGGSDPGAAANGFKEKDLNLSIGLHCYNELVRHGVIVLTSRTKDEDDSLTEEIRECNAFGPDFAVDIHNNAGGGDGAEAFHHYKGGKSKELAENVMKQVVATGQNSRGVKTRVNSQGRDYYGFIRETVAPAIIVECAFVDNATDMQAIDTEEERKAMGIAIARGILLTGNIQPMPTVTVKPAGDKLYHVQVGAFSSENSAKSQKAELERRGFEAFIVKVDGLYKVQSGSFKNQDDADEHLRRIKIVGFKAFVTSETGTIIVTDEVKNEIKVGDKVRIQKGAPVFGKTTKFDGWVYDTALFVREINGNRVVVSTVQTGPTTGPVDKKYLTKI